MVSSPSLLHSLLVKCVLESSSSLTSWREDLLPQGHVTSLLEGPLRRISFLGIYWQLNSKLPGSGLVLFILHPQRFAGVVC